MKRYLLTLDLKDDPALIEAYKAWHQKVWPEVKASIKNSGVESMQIYCLDTRLCMIMEVADDFTFERKARMDAENQVVQEWENLMLTYQQPLEGVEGSGKWRLMEEIFDLNEN